MSLSAAEILGLSGLRGDVVRLPADCVLVLHLDGAPDPRARRLLSEAMRRLAERWDVDPARIVCLERGMTLDALGRADLARMGLRRVEDI